MTKNQTTRGGHVPTGTSAERRARTAGSVTEKGERTRRLIIDSARAVFEEKGYLDVRVSDIVRRAGVAHGSFYTYFPSKLEVFQAIVNIVGEEIDQAVQRTSGESPGDWRQNLLNANYRYLEVYQRNHKIYILIEQTATLDEQVKAYRLAGRRRHLDRVESSLRHLQERGIASPELDIPLTAAALVTMLSSLAMWIHIEGKEIDLRTVAETVTDIWTKSIVR
ncbi:TetR/AcrR family transcriptional regulator [Actinocorallia aurantiaca]|uniref:HTH tetR-type domain-containing protein n=1 Tax=Actinocorallia aurantiaca TaxID=46204 RepID=A0ABN3UTC7_9ACTN